MTLIKTFLDTCKKHAKKIAVVDLHGTYTYEDIRKEALLYAARLSLINISSNHIGILLPNGKDFVTSFYGVLMTEKTPVPLNYLLSPQQLSFVIQNAEMDTIVTNTVFSPQMQGHIKNILLSDGNKDNITPMEEDRAKLGNMEELAAILYTSGTDTNPKGVMLTHRNFLKNLEGCISAFKFTERDILLGILPLFHTYALTTNLILPVCMGATVIYHERFSGPKVLDAIENHKITSLFAIPSMYRVLLRTAKTSNYNLSSLKLCTSGGEPLPGDVLESFNKTFSVPLTEGYGLTEATAIVSVNLPDKFKYGSIGPPLNNLEIKIADDNGYPQPKNNEGEIWVKGPNVMKGYFKLPAETKKTITSDGWLKTGDYGKLDEEGFLWITGRKKELIIISGENVSPNEIEHVISGYEKVFEVAVLGVSDKVSGEVPKAFIALRENMTCSESEIKEYCAKYLPLYKMPRYFEFLKELPHGPTGKVLKRALKQE